MIDASRDTDATAADSTSASPSPAPGRKRARVLLTLPGGGFGGQILSLMNLLGPDYEYHGVMVKGVWENWPAKLTLPCQMWELTSAGLFGQTRFDQVVSTLRGFVEAFTIVRRANPDAIVCLGTAMSVPLCFWGRVLGKRTVYIESISRPYHMTWTGTIVRVLHLSDRIYAQWPELTRFPRVRYRGRLL